MTASCNTVAAVQTIPNPDSWLDVFTIISVTLLVVVPSWLAARNQRTLKTLDKSISNGHTTPIREDLDHVRSTLGHIRGDLHSMRTELGDIRDEIREERRQRQHLEKSFDTYRRDH